MRTTRNIALLMWFVIFGLILAMALTGCGAPDTDNVDVDHFKTCLDAGGSYHQDRDGWSCDLPEVREAR